VRFGSVSFSFLLLCLIFDFYFSPVISTIYLRSVVGGRFLAEMLTVPSAIVLIICGFRTHAVTIYCRRRGLTHRHHHLDSHLASSSTTSSSASSSSPSCSSSSPFPSSSCLFFVRIPSLIITITPQELGSFWWWYDKNSNLFIKYLIYFLDLWDFLEHTFIYLILLQ